MKKNDIFKAEIVDITGMGMGVAKYDGMTYFVPGALTGDVATLSVTKVGKNFCYARIVSLDEPSAHRVSPRCEVANKCGGCQIQSLSYDEQVKLKTNMVYNNLRRIGGFDDTLLSSVLESTVYMDEPYRYRNKSQYPVGEDASGKPVFGFYASRSHRIVETNDCLIGIEENKDILAAVKEYMLAAGVRAYDELSGKGVVRHILIRKAIASDSIMVCLVVNADSIPKQDILISKLCEIDGISSICLNINKKSTNKILGDRTEAIYGKSTIRDDIHLFDVTEDGSFEESERKVSFDISAKSFYQVNTIQMQKLYSIALDYAELSSDDVIWDLYCGIGTIGLCAASKVKKVYGVEIVDSAVDDARDNAKLNGIKNAEFMLGAAERVVPKFYEEHTNEACDVIFIDPPRKGSDGLCLDTILKASPRKIVYVSCDSATLARDLKYLCKDGKYELRRVRIVDQFCHSMHVETVVLLSHKEPDSKIGVKVDFGEQNGQVPLDKISKKAESYKPMERVTYKKIQKYVEEKFGFKVHTAYIAEVKRSLGLDMYDAPNAVEELKNPRKHPTPEKVAAIKDALRHFNVIPV